MIIIKCKPVYNKKKVKVGIKINVDSINKALTNSNGGIWVIHLNNYYEDDILNNGYESGVHNISLNKDAIDHFVIGYDVTQNQRNELGNYNSKWACTIIKII